MEIIVSAGINTATSVDKYEVGLSLNKEAGWNEMH